MVDLVEGNMSWAVKGRIMRDAKIGISLLSQSSQDQIPTNFGQYLLEQKHFKKEQDCG